MAPNWQDPWKSSILDPVTIDFSHGSVSLLQEPNKISSRRITVSADATSHSNDSCIASCSKFSEDSCRDTCSVNCEVAVCRCSSMQEIPNAGLRSPVSSAGGLCELPRGSRDISHKEIET